MGFGGYPHGGGVIGGRAGGTEGGETAVPLNFRGGRKSNGATTPTSTAKCNNTGNNTSNTTQDDTNGTSSGNNHNTHDSNDSIKREQQHQPPGITLTVNERNSGSVDTSTTTTKNT